MKKLFLFIFCTILTITSAFAKDLSFNNEVYELQYSACQGPACINEYVRPTQNLQNWTNIITTHRFTNQNSPQNYLNTFLARIDNNPKMFYIDAIEEKNLISFGIISPKGFIEYNVIRVEKSSEGIKAIQFGHKYKFKDEETFKLALERCKKYNMKYSNCLINTPIPAIETQNYEKK